MYVYIYMTNVPYVYLLDKQFQMLILNPLQWRYNERDGLSNHAHLDGLRKRLYRRISKKTSMLRVTGLCEGNSAVTD